MRITPSMIAAQVQRELQAALAAIAHQQEMLASGRRILAPSDDPAGAAQALTIRARQAAGVQFQRNVATARASLSAADDALRAVADTITRAREAAVQGASDTNDAVARRAIGDTVNQLLETLVALGNEQGGTGSYLFGGQESTTPPYTVTRDAAGRIVAVTPNSRGIDEPVAGEMGAGVIVPTGVSGTSVFGAAADPAYAFDVLIRLRDDLHGRPHLSFQPDVGLSGAASPSPYAGIAGAIDLEIVGPAGTANVAPTAAGDDTVSYSGNAASAIAAAARINAQSLVTGVTAAVTRAQVAYSRGSFAADVTLDGSPGARIVVNGVSIVGAVTGATPAERRDALVALIDAQSGTTGVTASAVPGGAGFALTAADGRNISLETDAATSPGSVNATVFGFAAGLTGTGAATSVVARGGVVLSASAPVRVTVATGVALGGQMRGQGTTGLQEALDDLGAMLDRAVAPATVVGARLAWLGILDERHLAESVGLSKDLSSVEDIDVAKAASDLAQLQAFYEGALASGARLLQTTLVNFLR